MPSLSTTAPACLCTNPPSHTTDEHLAIMKSQPVFPAPPLQIGMNVLFSTDPRGPTKLLPYPDTFKNVRVWNAGCGTPAPGSSSYARLDATLTRLAAYGVVVQLGNNVQTVPSDAVYNTWIDGILALAKVHNNILAVSISNEPNNASRAPIPMTRLGELAKLAQRLRAVGIPLIGPSTEGRGGMSTYFEPWLASYANLIDIVDHHPYYWQADYTVYPIMLAYIKQLAATAAKYNKPLWCTEGQLISMTTGSVTGPKATQFMVDYFKALADGGCRVFHWWNYDSRDMPIIIMNSDRATLTPEGLALHALAQHYLTA